MNKGRSIFYYELIKFRVTIQRLKGKSTPENGGLLCVIPELQQYKPWPAFFKDEF